MADSDTTNNEFDRPVRYGRTTGPKAAALMVGTAKRPPDPSKLPRLPTDESGEE